MRVYGVTGWKNSGKTTLVERLVAEITGRGLSVFQGEISAQTPIGSRRTMVPCNWRSKA
jgi:putative protein kinase ArgK-like GTPase of G3E family